MDPDAVLALLHTTFWAQGMSRDVLARAMANSVVFALLEREALIGPISQPMPTGPTR
jgi:hypothetical protein